MILETWDRVPRRAPCMEPASPSACQAEGGRSRLPTEQGAQGRAPSQAPGIMMEPKVDT
ncbi:unnamed protein product [Nyctereutes procyonoides]|uniref:(raccoon dog) hypothetical protein n=1 Tax=Nyctereutes procyonoides TaxID=34880 RepID=A0A811ZFT9_NYCPR|nr:unnamed protein product [Nyctereutes procyonoides]